MNMVQCQVEVYPDEFETKIIRHFECALQNAFKDVDAILT